MTKTIKTKLGWLAAIGIVAVVIGGVIYNQQQPGPLDDFARCLGDQGVKFYGAFWCSHCKEQKDAFGKSQKYLPYIECSLPNGRGQVAICDEAGIEGYPTWVYGDGSRDSGQVSLGRLAEKSSCQLPSTYAN